MAKHAWVLENVASYLADGLNPAELERLELHVASCPKCAEAVQQARSLDDMMRELFADVQPDPALEDRMIQALRQSAPPRWRPLSRHRKLALGTAAALLIGVLGSFITYTIEQGGLTFPGTSQYELVLVGGTSMIYSDGERNDMRDISAATIASPNGRSVALQDVNALASQTRQVAVAFSPDGITRGVRPSTFNFPTRGPRETTTWFIDDSMSTSGSAGDSVVVTGEPRDYALLDSFAIVQGVPHLATEVAGGGGQVLASVDDGLPATGGGMGGGGIGGMIAAPEGSASPEFGYYSYTNKLPATQTATVGYPAATGNRVAAVQLHFKPNDLLVGMVVSPAQTVEPAVAQAGQDAARTATRQTAVEGTEADQDQPPAVTQRKIIRSGDMEFEVESFDSAVEKITKITAEEGGFIATVDSQQLPNGKMLGSVVIRVLPERLDTLVLKLRALGELMSQKIGSQDITKQYTDLESRLRAARAMEERLLAMIKNGKGDIEHLLLAEKELGVWRMKIEETEGELRYYKNVIALSTLKISLAEKEIRAAAALTETERVQMGIEVEDVEKAHREALKAVDEADGLVTKSELKQHEAEQYSAVINFEIDRDAAGPLRDRLRQIGRVTRLEIDRVQQAEGGSGLPRDARTVRKDTQFSVSLYNVANVAPRETIHVTLACTDTEAAYRTILADVRQAGGRIVTSSLNSQHSQKTTGSVQFELPVAVADAVLTDVKAAGEVMRLEVTENPDSKNVTKSKRGFNVELWAMGLVAPRETIVLQVATDDVPAGYRTLQEAVRNAKGRILNAQLNEQDKQNITAQLDFDVPRDNQPALDEVGEVFSRNVTRSQDDENVVDSKVRLQVALIDQARIPPRETITLGIEVDDVDQETSAMTKFVAERKGRIVESHLAHERSGRVTAKVVFDVPLASASDLVEKFKASGTVRAQQSTRNTQVPDGKLAIARLHVTLSNAELIVPGDGGLWAQIRTGLATSFTAISWSITVVIVGLCFVLPWAIVLYAVYRVIARIRRKASPAQTTA